MPRGAQVRVQKSMGEPLYLKKLCDEQSYKELGAHASKQHAVSSKQHAVRSKQHAVSDKQVGSKCSVPTSLNVSLLVSLLASLVSPYAYFEPYHQLRATAGGSLKWKQLLGYTALGYTAAHCEKSATLKPRSVPSRASGTS